MKKCVIFLVLTFLLLLSSQLYAETKVDISGQVRLRGESSRKSFHSDMDHFQTFNYLRSRINVKAVVDKNAKAFVQFQDSRRLGDPGQSGGLNSTDNVDLHQAYLKYNLWTKPDWSIGVLGGRFEFVWGNQRLLGSVGWHNIGRSWEGGLAWYDTKKLNLTLASLKALERNNNMYNADFDVFAVTGHFKEINLQLLAVLENDADTSSFIVNNIQNLERTTLAAYYKKKKDNLDMEFNLALQGGKMSATDSTEFDISAMLFTGEVGYSFEGEKNGRVALGIDYASGDDDLTDLDFKQFNNLYWTGHKFNGFMDYFLGGGPNGLVDFMLRGKFDITNGWTVGGDIHFFAAAEEYAVDVDETAAVQLENTKDVGTEIDIFVKTNRVKGVGLMWGLSMFSPKDDFAIYIDNEYDKSSGVWAYGQATVNF